MPRRPRPAVLSSENGRYEKPTRGARSGQLGQSCSGGPACFDVRKGVQGGGPGLGLTLLGVLQALTASAHKGWVAARDLGSEEMITRPVMGTVGSKLVRLMGSYKPGNLEILRPTSNVSF